MVSFAPQLAGVGADCEMGNRTPRVLGMENNPYVNAYHYSHQTDNAWGDHQDEDT